MPGSRAQQAKTDQMAVAFKLADETCAVPGKALKMNLLRPNERTGCGKGAHLAYHHHCGLLLPASSGSQADTSRRRIFGPLWK